MTDSKIPYQIQITPNPIRTSLNFLQNSNQILTNYSSSSTNTSSNSLFFSRLYSSVRILNGPQPTIKTVVIFRAITQQLSNSIQMYYVYTGIYLVDFASSSLRFSNIFQTIQPIQEKVRDIAVSPNGKQLLILNQNHIDRYTLQKQIAPTKKQQYQLTLQKSINYTQPVSIVDVNYHPNGQFAIGLAHFQNSTNSTNMQIKPFKINPTTLQLNFTQDIANKCISPNIQFFQYLKKWTMAIDKNQDNAMVVGYLNTTCIIDTRTMKIDYLPINRPTTMQIIAKYPKTNEVLTLSPTIMISSTAFVNSSNTGYFLAFQPLQNHANRYLDLSNTPTFANLFQYVPLAKQGKDSSPSKCIDIVHINAFACFKLNTQNIYIVKIDENAMINFDLGDIENVVKQKIGTNDELNGSSYALNTQNQIIQEIYYDQKTGQICQIYDLSVQCFEITTQCISGGDWKPINTCQDICQSTGTNIYWNPISMTCQTCTNCNCSSTYSYNPYYGHCVLNCSQILFAIPDSQFRYSTKCACQYPFVWYPELQICRINCTNILHTNPKIDLGSVPPNECPCEKQYTFIIKTNSQFQTGICTLACKNGQLPTTTANGTQHCPCTHNETWDQTTLRCMNSQTHNTGTSSGIPGWGIALIVILVLALVGIGFVIVRKIVKKKHSSSSKTKGNIQLPPYSQRQKSKKNLPISLKDIKSTTEQQLTSNKFRICSICYNKQTQINCQGPCGHFYHFSCIKEKIDQGLRECPICFRNYSNGLADLKLVEKEEEIWSIQEK